MSKVNKNGEYNILIDNNYLPNTRLLTNPNNLNNNNEIDLPKLGRKNSTNARKSVSFKNEISVTQVENWKKFNHDVSEENEFYKLKKEIKEYKKMKKKEEEKNKCCCEIF